MSPARPLDLMPGRSARRRVVPKPMGRVEDVDREIARCHHPGRRVIATRAGTTTARGLDLMPGRSARRRVVPKPMGRVEDADRKIVRCRHPGRRATLTT